MDKVGNSISQLLNYIESESYRGYDPYDALLSPVFKFKLLNRNKTLRFGFQQLVKRSPVNLRHLLSVPKGYNPVTLGLCLQSYAALMGAFPERKEGFNAKAEFLISELKNLIPNGFHGACWGYDFPWQARYAEIAALQPTIVATGIITNALFRFYKETGNTEAFELCKSASDFVRYDLNRSAEGNTFCFSYSPFDNQRVFNASAKGLRLLSQVYSITQDKSLIPVITGAVKYIINRQQNDGSWYYSDSGRWVDNYHTGYVLDCLHEYATCTGDLSYENNLKNGFEFYRMNFFTPQGLPKLVPHKLYPVDSTAAGQSLLSLVRFQDKTMARLVGEWMISHMQSNEGYFYYRKGRALTNRTSFMRWSNAWMLAGLSELIGDMD